jgi:hypothetical protein
MRISTMIMVSKLIDSEKSDTAAPTGKKDALLITLPLTLNPGTFITFFQVMKKPQALIIIPVFK